MWNLPIGHIMNITIPLLYLLIFFFCNVNYFHILTLQLLTHYYSTECGRHRRNTIWKMAKSVSILNRVFHSLFSMFLFLTIIIIIIIVKRPIHKRYFYCFKFIRNMILNYWRICENPKRTKPRI